MRTNRLHIVLDKEMLRLESHLPCINIGINGEGGQKDGLEVQRITYFALNISRYYDDHRDS